MPLKFIRCSTHARHVVPSPGWAGTWRPHLAIAKWFHKTGSRAVAFSAAHEGTTQSGHLDAAGYIIQLRMWAQG